MSLQKMSDQEITKTPPKFRLVLIRHGESEWNMKNLFTGWYDSKLSERGTHEALAAGKAIRNANLKFDVAFTSVLARANETLRIILEESNQENIPIEKSWRLNERHYGALTGLNKAETALKYSDEQVQIWRRSYDIPPPPMEQAHPFYDIITRDNRYRGFLKKDDFPPTESLKNTIDRMMPYWKDTIIPYIMMRKNILISAHGNSLRGIVKILDDISDSDIVELNIPTGVPFMYELDCKLKPMGPMKFLGDDVTVRKSLETVGPFAKP